MAATDSTTPEITTADLELVTPSETGTGDQPETPAEPPVANEPPVVEEPPVNDEPPTENEPPVDNDPPVDDKPPTEDEPPAVEEPPAENEPPVTNEPPAAPPNDDIAAAISLSLGVPVQGTTAGAKLQEGEVDYFADSTVWYRYVPETLDPLTITGGSAVTLVVVAVPADMAPADLTSFSGFRGVTNSQISGDLRPSVSFKPQEGLAYYVQVAPVDDTQGAFTLQIDKAGADVDLTPPAPPTVNPPDFQGQVILSGTAEENARIRIFDNLNKVLGEGVADAQGKWEITLSAGLTEGKHDIVVQVRDAAGNATELAHELVVDTTPSGPRPSGQPTTFDEGTEAAEEWTGTDGNDQYRSHGGGDRMQGGLGDDYYQVDSEKDVVIEKSGEGVDTIETWLKTYELPENVENLTLTGNSYSTGTGNALDNIIIGNVSTNTLDGGAGDDILTGGGSNHEPGHVTPRGDTFIIRKGEGNDTITDFQHGKDGGDVIRLAGFGYQSLEQLLAKAEEVGNNVVFQLADDQRLTVRNARKADFDHYDFDYTARITKAVETTADGKTFVVLTGTAEIGEDINVYVKGSPFTEKPDGSIDASRLVKVIDGNWTYRVAVEGAGPHSFSVASMETKQDDSGVWHYFEFSTSDTVAAGQDVPEAPDAPTLAFAPGQDTGAKESDGLTNKNDLILTGTAAKGSTVSVHEGGKLLAADIAVDAEGKWTFTAKDLADGKHVFTATATASGGVSEASDAVSMIVDTVAEPMTLALHRDSDSGAANNITNKTALVLTGTAEAGSSIAIYEKEHQVGAASASGPDGSWSFSTTDLQSGDHVFTARAVDLAGNEISATLSVTITAPRDAGDFSAALPLFDAAYYLAHNQDVAQSGMDALKHYQTFGWQEHRDPNAFFHTGFYLNQNRDVAESGVDALQHYLQFGAEEGRAASIDFDGKAYLAFHADVAKAGMDALEHYLRFGQSEDREIFSAKPHATGPQNPLVDSAFYFETYADVAREGLDPSTHYAQFGAAEGRNPNAYFDAAYYLAKNPDVAKAEVDPLTHYLEHGWTEGRDPSTAFSTAKYLQAYADVAQAGINPLLHYMQFGQNDGHVIPG